MSAFSILAKIPWVKIARYGPTIYTEADKIYKLIQGKLVTETKSSLDERIKILETNELQQAELVKHIARQVGDVSSALQTMSKRIQISLILSLIAFIMALALLIIVVVK
ncbi:MAG: hypothetical protein EHM72_06910 [Calditrichaeota bacterium]|nr:MAG: hypothetical protein EHM72_06910 [Calditrichota bacterium]